MSKATPNPVDLNGKWSISTDEENYHGIFDSMEEAIGEGETYECDFWVGQCAAPTQPEELFDGHAIERWLDVQVLQHDDYASEWAEGAVSATEQQVDELASEIRPLIAAWLDRHGLRPTHFNIDPMSVRKIKFEVAEGA